MPLNPKHCSLLSLSVLKICLSLPDSDAVTNAEIIFLMLTLPVLLGIPSSGDPPFLKSLLFDITFGNPNIFSIHFCFFVPYVWSTFLDWGTCSFSPSQDLCLPYLCYEMTWIRLIWPKEVGGRREIVLFLSPFSISQIYFHPWINSRGQTPPSYFCGKRGKMLYCTCIFLCMVY